VSVKPRSLLAAAVGLWLTLPLTGQEPARLAIKSDAALKPTVIVSVNQQKADEIVDHLRQSGSLHNYRVDINFQDGIAEVGGRVADPGQREIALCIVRGVPGVERVLDQLQCANAITQAQGLATGQESFPVPAQLPDPGKPATGGAVVGGEPVPIYQAPPPSPYDLNPPKMPPYAWPTYAPYNNYSRVAYPEAYPYNAWPYIGPIHPFPKVPLGWRSVKLEWHDGFWWYSTHGTSFDWWRLRFW